MPPAAIVIGIQMKHQPGPKTFHQVRVDRLNKTLSASSKANVVNTVGVGGVGTWQEGSNPIHSKTSSGETSAKVLR